MFQKGLGTKAGRWQSNYQDTTERRSSSKWLAVRGVPIALATGADLLGRDGLVRGLMYDS